MSEKIKKEQDWKKIVLANVEKYIKSQKVENIEFVRENLDDVIGEMVRNEADRIMATKEIKEQIQQITKKYVEDNIEKIVKDSMRGARLDFDW